MFICSPIQGVLAARFAASDPRLNERVASVSSAHGMNKGTHFSEGFCDSVAEGSIVETLGLPVINFVFNTLELLSATDKATDGDFDSPERGQQDLLRLAKATNRELVQQYGRDYTDMAALPSKNCMTVNNGDHARLQQQSLRWHQPIDGPWQLVPQCTGNLHQACQYVGSSGALVPQHG